MPKNNNNNSSQDAGSSASSTKERMRPRKTDSSNKIELEQIDHKNDISTTHQEEFREDITRQYSRSTQPGSLLDEQEKPHLKRALKARHVSLGCGIESRVAYHSTAYPIYSWPWFRWAEQLVRVCSWLQVLPSLLLVLVVLSLPMVWLVSWSFSWWNVWAKWQVLYKMHWHIPTSTWVSLSCRPLICQFLVVSTITQADSSTPPWVLHLAGTTGITGLLPLQLSW